MLGVFVLGAYQRSCSCDIVDPVELELAILTEDDVVEGA